MNEEQLSTLIREQATRHLASARLKAQIQTAVVLTKATAQERARPGSIAHHWTHWLSRLPFEWQQLSAGFACGVVFSVAAGALLYQLHAHQISPRLDVQMVAAHVQSMKVGPLYAVASTDQHTVKPWFQGKLDFAPTVVKLDAAGFNLVGGRIDQVANAPVAALVYTRNQHIINVFTRPDSGRPQPPERAQVKGFNLVAWGDGQMHYWVTSDVNAVDLDAFVTAWQSAGKSR